MTSRLRKTLFASLGSLAALPSFAHVEWDDAGRGARGAAAPVLIWPSSLASGHTWARYPTGRISLTKTRVRNTPPTPSP